MRLELQDGPSPGFFTCFMTKISDGYVDCQILLAPRLPTPNFFQDESTTDVDSCWICTEQLCKQDCLARARPRFQERGLIHTCSRLTSQLRRHSRSSDSASRHFCFRGHTLTLSFNPCGPCNNFVIYATLKY